MSRTTERRAELAELRASVDPDLLAWRRAASGRVKHKWLTGHDTLCGQRVIGGIDRSLVFKGLPRCAACERFTVKVRKDRRALRRAGG